MHLLKWSFPDGTAREINIELEQYSQESKYAILSHRWGKAEDEVTFQDMLSGSKVAKTKAGYAKLEGCCRQAHLDGHQRVWVDTCCIDKSSSAELSEAITSMYSYYENSQVCYAFLNDIEKRITPPMEGDDPTEPFLVSKSAWSKRGWTLQELIAPTTVKFFDRYWTFLGEKTQDDISKDIEKNSGIHRSILKQPDILRAVSVSSRMSWAVGRETARIEDRAYSLMGIFGVYMSPIYGEGHNAFMRLQEEIMRSSNDHTLFAWTLPPPKKIQRRHTFERVSTMLALSPDQFGESSGFMQRPYDSPSNGLDADGGRFDYAITNAGLAINLPIIQIDENKQLYAAILACTEAESVVRSAILLHTTADTPRGYFWRANTDAGPIERSGKLWFQGRGRNSLRMSTVYILPKLTSVSPDYIEPRWGSLQAQECEEMASQNLPTPSNTRSSTSTFKVQRTLIQAKDPCFIELQDLFQVRQMIFGQTVQLYKEQVTRPQTLLYNIPSIRSPQFIGRAAELQKIWDLFERSDSKTKSPNIVAITGMGGVGKTMLASEFAYRCCDGDIFPPAIWIDASNPFETYKGLYQIAKFNGFHHTSRATQLDAVADVLQWLSSNGQWLLIFDDVRGSEEMGDFWKSIVDADMGPILITSRERTIWSDLGSKHIALGPWSDVEAGNVLQSLTHTNEDFSELIADLGVGLPLALALFAVTYRIKKGSRSIFARNKTYCQNNRLATKRTMGVEFDTLRPSSIALLSVISFLDPEFIHCRILIPSTPSPLSEYPQDEEKLHENLEDLTRDRLIKQLEQKDTTQGGCVSIHWRVQMEVQDILKPETYSEVLATAVSLVYSAWVKRVSERDGPKWISKNLLPHLLRLEPLAEKLPESEDDFSTRRNLAWLVRSRKELVFES